MEFEEIRPYHDEELPQVFEELIADPAFQQVACAVMPGVPFEAIAQKMRASKTKQEFQENLCYGILHKLAKDTTDGLILESMAVLNKQSAYTYVSNHRDIILDSGFLSVLLVEQGLDTVEIAIGDLPLDQETGAHQQMFHRTARADHAPDAGIIHTDVPLYALYHCGEKTVYLDCPARRACKRFQ